MQRALRPARPAPAVARQRTAGPRRRATLALAAQLFGVCVCLGVGAACASAPPERPLVLVVTNGLGRPIEAIERKGCDEPESAFVVIEGSRLGAGESGRFVMPEGCLDLVAHDARGRLVGRQSGLYMRHGTRWALRR